MAGAISVLLTATLMVLSTACSRSAATPASGPSEPALDGGHRTRARSLTLFYNPARRYAKPMDQQEFLDDDDEPILDTARGKRRFDDYGHMRFGKRGDDQFDDYGHMRFGRSVDK